MLEGIDLSKAYGQAKILTDINVKVEPGTITTVIGPSGCGKTTLLRSLALLDPPTSGRVSVDGQRFVFPRDGGNSPFPIWPDVTVVFQQLFLWPHLTIRENAMLPLRTRGDANAHDKVDRIIQDFDISRFADRYPNQVSIGQRQLGALIRALALEPKYILLDEVTSALDVEYIALVLSCLKRLRSEGVGLLVVSHLLRFAQDSADQVVFLVDGQVMESGPTDILSNPGTERLERFLGQLFQAR